MFSLTQNMTVETGKMTLVDENLQIHWLNIAPLLSIRNQREYDAAVKRLNQVLDQIGDNENHPLYSFLDTLGTLIHAYEAEHYPLPDVTGVEVLRYLMDEHGLTQSDLPELGSQGVVSEILNGKRALNVRHLRLLAQKFNVSSAVFI
jgi:HTH-type transcriptional regulator/antitoxin HigA